MKIGLSLRLYFIGAMLMLGITMVAGFTALTVNYFIEGMDTVTQFNMISAAQNSVAEDGAPDQVLDYHIATRWQDVPEVIRMNIPKAPSKDYGFVKYIDDPWFERPKAGYFVLLVPGVDGKKYFVSHLFDSEHQCEVEHEEMSPFFLIGLVAVSSLILFVLILILMIRSMTHPVEQLGDWAKSLSPEQLKKAAPNFRYTELNKLAQLIRGSLSTVQNSLQREHDFLRHASHELRTPIAVLRSNIELLKKMNSGIEGKEKKVVERLERAGLTMGDLTETLLWLSREHDSPPITQMVCLDELLKQLINDLKYLLQGKEVQVVLNVTGMELELPETACRMVLSNLIRNAFQHTQSGEVKIRQNGAEVAISNHNLGVNWENKDTQQELGFGLGLQLTEKLTQRFGWEYQNQVSAQGHAVSVNFSVKQ